MKTTQSKRPTVVPGAHETLRVEYAIECLPEDLPFRGHMSCGDAMVDKETEDWIAEQLDRGNEWAWCCVKVTATFTDSEGNTYVGADYLGGCSYKSRADFCTDDGYFPDMKTAALDDLKAKLQAAASAGVEAQKAYEELIHAH